MLHQYTMVTRQSIDNIKAKLEGNPRILHLVGSIDIFYSRSRKLLVPLGVSEVDKELEVFIKLASFEVNEYRKICESIIDSQGNQNKPSQCFKYYMFFKKD
jgi:hypothetical protein